MKRKLELNELGLPMMCANALSGVGVTTFQQLLDVEVHELKSIPNLGAKGIEYILSLVSAQGHKLQGQDLYEQKKNRTKTKREWVNLTDAEMEDLLNRFARYELLRVVQKTLKEKNT
jgi:hypothetical protein